MSRYARHESTEILMTAYAFDDGPVQQWVPAEGQKMPRDLREALEDPDVEKFAWNRPFEFEIWRHVEGIFIPDEEWYDPMILAYTLSLPGNLEDAGTVIGLDDEKLKSPRGKALIRRFSMPRKPTKNKPWTRATHRTDPDEWEEYKEYNRQDVIAERAFFHRAKRWDLPAHEWENWEIDQWINRRGIPINMRVVANAIRIAAYVVERRLKEMAEITGLANPNSNAQLLPWLRENGYPFADLRKGHVVKALRDIEEECTDPATEIETRGLRRVLALRQEVSKSSVKKFKALQESADEDGLLRYTLQFAGAGRTWRWAGRKYQAQNLARPVWYLSKPEQQIEAVRSIVQLDPWAFDQVWRYPMDVLSSSVRPVVEAPEGYVFLDADLNAIENRVLGYLADEPAILDVFRSGLDPYIAFAVDMTGKSYEQLWAEYKAGDKVPRTEAKPAVLGAGYMLSGGDYIEDEETGELVGTGLLGYAQNMGITLTKETAERSIKVWRKKFSNVVDFWYAVMKAAMRTVRTGRDSDCGPVSFDLDGPFLRMFLPSGRELHYVRPQIVEKKTPWGEMRPTLIYEGITDKGSWGRISTHPGKVTENADQAIARDILMAGIRRARRRYNIDVRMHVHDQIVALAPEDQAEKQLKLLIECMEEPMPWARDALILKAEGHISKYFVKD